MPKITEKHSVQLPSLIQSNVLDLESLGNHRTDDTRSILILGHRLLSSASQHTTLESRSPWGLHACEVP